MLGNKFLIRAEKFGVKSLSLKDVATNELLDLLSERIANKKIEYEVEYVNERNIGNYIIFEYNGIKNYIILLNYRDASPSTQGRNSFIQSIPTAYRTFLEDTFENKKIYYYDVYYRGGSYEPYIELFLKLSMSLGIIPLYENNILPYLSLDELIATRNMNRKKSKQNNPSFIEKTVHGINIYGKVFGANSKDTEMICHAVNKWFDGKITLYQITDNTSTKLSKNFLNYLESTNKFFIKDDVYSFKELVSSGTKAEDVNLRNPKFITNLFDKYGDKKCALCSCSIHQIIDAAHIFPVEAIKEMPISEKEKLLIATSADNGVWLCKNHHRLFDSHLLLLDTGNYHFGKDLKSEHALYIEKSIEGDAKDTLASLDGGLLRKRYDFYNIS